METIPEEYLIEGLSASDYSKPDDKNEAVYYTTPNGTRFAIAKDFLGIQICMRGRFWPPPFTAFFTMEAAVLQLRKSTASAVEFFDKTKIELDKQKGES